MSAMPAFRAHGFASGSIKWGQRQLKPLMDVSRVEMAEIGRIGKTIIAYTRHFKKLPYSVDLCEPPLQTI